MKILIAESTGFPSEAYKLLSQAGDVTLADLDRSALEAAVGDYNVLWVRLRHQIDARLLDRAAALQVLATPTTGLTHVDTGALRHRGIDLLCLRGETAFLNEIRGTAEHTIGLILSLLRHIPAAVEHVAGGGWDRDRFQGSELYGKTVGIVGYGRLGRIVARYLRAFDARVLAYDPHPHPEDAIVPLEELLAASDIVTLHASLTEENRRFFGLCEFASMKSGSVFVNTARGELVDETALLDTLRSGHLAGAALDVLSHERPAGMQSHPLVEYAQQNNNVIITPHIGGCTAESMHKTELFLAKKLCDRLSTAGILPAIPAFVPV